MPTISTEFWERKEEEANTEGGAGEGIMRKYVFSLSIAIL